ncbi:MAG: sigma-70 family RNA polymerase sigma factor [Candidatus Galacturonibacter soehngenii]|uniref:RNA polymerase sigma factor n=1 Tax=Candidatus Galacturonatibacter soehngenii TaxID=2307010 RepID=A0A7V7QLK9_9FIRM|nr:sigma-70 family RNA polymerase sigma factor [Candidatus Galacturonibacter soehngenii]MBA4687305.1 sigma-70 family RNA polymerase sigma factor [Candidatus Galacturonibacter soehngenii]
MYETSFNKRTSIITKRGRVNLNSKEELHLVKKAMKGNPKAYGNLIHYYQDYLYKTAFLYVKDEDSALDIVQESILKGYESIRKLKHPQFFKTWITKILINNSLTVLKRRNSTISIETIEDITKSYLQPMLEEKLDLYEAIDNLSEIYKTIIILKYFNDLKINEISSLMNIPEGSVKAYLYRAKKELKQYLKEDYLYAK